MRTLKGMMILMVVVFSLMAQASNSGYYLTLGRGLMFDGTLTGLELAYETFDNGLKDASCTDCSQNRELRFLHALTRTAMLVVHEDNTPVDSVFELAGAFGLDVIGNSVEPNQLQLKYVTNAHDYYEVPGDAPTEQQLLEMIDTQLIPELDAIIAEFELIQDSPTRFKIFFHPAETGLLTELEVDFTEVLAIKGILKAVKAHLVSQCAYDFAITAEDKLIEKMYGNLLSINHDMLVPHSDLFNVKTMAVHGEDGAAILSQAKNFWIQALQNYLDAYNYMISENAGGADPQEDEFLYVDANSVEAADQLKSKVEQMLVSLGTDQPSVYWINKTNRYNIFNTESSLVGEVELVWDMTNDGGDEGSLYTIQADGWDIDEFCVEPDGYLDIEMSRYWNDCYEWGYASGILSPDRTQIQGLNFESWGCEPVIAHGLSATMISEELENVKVDLNPMFGSPKFPKPVNPRDILPVFDDWNGAQPGTVGAGLGNDATLGGILPDANQMLWQNWFNFQPGGIVQIAELYPWQMGSGFVGFWLSNQMVFQDMINDVSSYSHNNNVDKVYLAYNDTGLYGAVSFADVDIYSSLYVTLLLSYSNEERMGDGTIVLTMNGWGAGEVYKIDRDGRTLSIGWLDTQRTNYGIGFRLPWESIPGVLPGRFISVETGEDENPTNLKIDYLGSISGYVDCDMYNSGPIYVEAYTDIYDPEGSVVSRTMLDSPGHYVLDGIGLGWSGYVRAYTPIFGSRNLFELGASKIEAHDEVTLWVENLSGIDLSLEYPQVLQCGQNVVDGLYFGEPVIYAFDAVAGYEYDFFLTWAIYAGGSGSFINTRLLDRNASDELLNGNISGQWLCPASGRYYILIETLDPESWMPNYDLTMTCSDFHIPGDIGSRDGKGTRDETVNELDIVTLGSNWLGDCGYPYWCEGADIDESGMVDLKDFAILAQHWMDGIVVIQ